MQSCLLVMAQRGWTNDEFPFQGLATKAQSIRIKCLNLLSNDTKPTISPQVLLKWVLVFIRYQSLRNAHKCSPNAQKIKWSWFMVLKSRESRVNFNQWSQAHRNLNEIHFERPKKASSDYTHHYYLVISSQQNSQFIQTT